MTVELFTMALVATFLSPFIVGVSLVRAASIAIGLAIVAQLTTIIVDSFVILVACRMLVGAGCGVVFGVACLSTAAVDDSERYFGLGMATTNVFVFGLLFIVPIAQRMGNDTAVYGTLAAMMAIAAPFIKNLPQRTREKRVQQSEESAGISVTLTILMTFLLAVIVVNVGLSMVWAFSERISIDIGIESQRLGMYYAFSAVAMVFGATLFGFINIRFGRTLPLISCVLLGAVAALGLANADTHMVFLRSLCLHGAVFGFLVPHYVSIGTAIDQSGKMASTAGGIGILASALGPWIGGQITTAVGYRSMGWISGTLCIIAIVCFLPIILQLDRRRKTG